MPQFLIGYYGGVAPENPEEAMGEWYAWIDKLGAAMINSGNPVGKTVTVNKDGRSDEKSPHPIMGFSILEADDIDHACELVKDGPHLAYGGSMEISPIIEMPPPPGK